MNNVNTYAPTSRTLAVIDGGLNAKASIQTTPAVEQPKLLDQVRQAIRTRHYSYKTEESYVHWIKRFIFFNNKRHPAEMSEKEIAQIPFKPRQRIARERLHAEPGVERHFVSLPRCLA